MQTDELIKELANDACPVVRLRPPWQRFILWLLLSLTVTVSTTLLLGLRDDASTAITSPVFVFQSVLLLALGIVAGLAAVHSSIPGQTLPRALTFFITGLVLMLVISLMYLCVTTPGCIAGPGFACSQHIAMIGFLPALLLLIMLKRTAPERLVWTGALLGLTMLGLGALAVHFLCMSNDPLHLLVWHTLPGILFVAVGMVVATKLLRW